MPPSSQRRSSQRFAEYEHLGLLHPSLHVLLEVQEHCCGESNCGAGAAKTGIIAKTSAKISAKDLFDVMTIAVILKQIREGWYL